MEGMIMYGIDYGDKYISLSTVRMLSAGKKMLQGVLKVVATWTEGKKGRQNDTG